MLKQNTENIIEHIAIYVQEYIYIYIFFIIICRYSSIIRTYSITLYDFPSWTCCESRRFLLMFAWTLAPDCDWIAVVVVIFIIVGITSWRVSIAMIIAVAIAAATPVIVRVRLAARLMCGLIAIDGIRDGAGDAIAGIAARRGTRYTGTGITDTHFR